MARDDVSTGYKEPKRVTIEKAANGYVVTTYNDRGQYIEVAKTIKEANKISKRILGESRKKR